MAKPRLKMKARKMRRNGKSMREIAATLSVSKSSVSRWCSDILLTKKQREALAQKEKMGAKRGQLKGALVQKQRRLKKVEEFKRKGEGQMKKMTDMEFLTAGLGLYLGEGYKKGRMIIFANSDPEIIKFMICWFKKLFNIPKDRFAFRVIINKNHKTRENEVLKFWCKELGVKKEQFRSTQFVGPAPKKKFENHHNHYGVLDFRILKSTELFYKVQGLMHGMLKDVNG